MPQYQGCELAYRVKAAKTKAPISTALRLGRIEEQELSANEASGSGCSRRCLL
jgi:hypothetical protein